ncbi:MAG: FliG C-terminal domain-containing protein [Myxococcaceae bacterium]|nr:FliG C-terminal domain-containing protein [Myxococcaceae bacterium]
MEQFFASLSKRQTMLLLTSLAFGGSDAIGSYEHLSVDEEELLKHRAQSLLQIPRDKRIPLVIQEIKRIVTARRRQLGSADPKRLAALLSKERGALVEVVLRALPSELADACRAELGPRPTVKLNREVRADILSIVRWKLEEGLKRGAPQVGTFRFTDLLTMPPREIISICDRMGARVLAIAVAGLADADREAFLARLPPDQRSLAAKAAEAGRARRLSEADAKTVLEIHGALEAPSVGMRSAGAQRVMRAAVAQSPEFAQRLVERHAGHELGKLFQRWFKEEKSKPVKGDGGRLDIVEQIERLAQKGVIDRPLRLPPPMRPPGAPPGGPPMLQPVPLPVGRRTSQPMPAARPEAGSRVGPAPGREPPAPQGSRVGPPPTGPAAAPPRGGRPPNAAPRRDPIAERNARRAGVVSSRPAAPPPLGGQDPQASGLRRIMRDGKPLVREPGDAQPPPRVPRRAVTSPAVQEPPRRKGPTSQDTGRGSPVLKGSSGRGPGGRSG